jgi:hypothetical protein
VEARRQTWGDGALERPHGGTMAVCPGRYWFEMATLS